MLSRLIRAPTRRRRRLTDEELRDQLVTLLLAGHETTATALAWALYELGRDEALLARTVAAADDGDDAWLEAVLKESMRLHPVIPMVARTLMTPATIGGIDLPAGVTVGPSILLSHARAENHPEPERVPARALRRGSPAPNTWIPFGGGVRRCIGAGFSLMEGVVVLREVLTAYTSRRSATTAQGPQHHQRAARRRADPRHRTLTGPAGNPRAACPGRVRTIAPCEHRRVPGGNASAGCGWTSPRCASRATSGCCSRPARCSTSAGWWPTSRSRSRSTT